MIGWFKIIVYTKGWTENKDIICSIIKPTIERLEYSGDITNFFFFEYYNGKKPDRVTLTFYGNKEKVISEIEKYGKKIEIEDWNPSTQGKRFDLDYMLGIKLFEVGSRLALCSIDNRVPVEIIEGKKAPIFTAMKHAFLQNLGYSSQEEEQLGATIDPDLQNFFLHFRRIKIK